MRTSAWILAFITSILLGPAYGSILTTEQLLKLNAFRISSLAEIPMNTIEWKVGDSTDHSVVLGIGLRGTMHEEATREEGDAIWLKQDIKLQVVNDSSETLFDRKTGKVLKYIHNGKEEPVPHSDLDIIETKNCVVEVPKGKFSCLYVKAKSKNIEVIEFWINNREIPLAGIAKLFTKQSMTDITMELTDFHKN